MKWLSRNSNNPNNNHNAIVSTKKIYDVNFNESEKKNHKYGQTVRQAVLLPKK